MKSISEINTIKKRSKIDIESSLRKSFLEAMQEIGFVKLVGKLKIKEDILMKYTTKLQNTVDELKSCSGCKGLEYCKNQIIGHILYPEEYKETLVFSYTPCKHQKEEEKLSNITFFETPVFLRGATLSDLIKEKERKEVFEYIKDFLKKANSNEEKKGLFLHGSFGSGKSYILSALLNELSLKGKSCVNIYYPSMLKRLKDSFNDDNTSEMFEEILEADFLLIDDLGAENNTAWGRDEVLGTILQYRMDNNLVTFITSNFNIAELENHLKTTNKSYDEIKARRIIERIKQLTVDIELISENKRK